MEKINIVDMATALFSDVLKIRISANPNLTVAEALVDAKEAATKFIKFANTELEKVTAPKE